MSSPIPFVGTAEERTANFYTHIFTTDNGEDFNCINCDCKPWHKTADYPCGADVPRTGD